MNQFTQLLVLIFLSSNLHLSAAEINRTDTIGKFNEVTDIELRIKNLTDTTQTFASQDIILPESVQMIHPDSIIVTKVHDSLATPIIDVPKKPAGFFPVVITTSLDSLYNRNSDGIIQLPDPSLGRYAAYSNLMNFRDTMLYNPLFLPVVFTGRIEVSEIGRAHV